MFFLTGICTLYIFFPGSCKALMDTHPCQRHDLELRCEQMPQTSHYFQEWLKERQTWY